MTILYSFYLETLTVPIPDETAEYLCNQIKNYFETKKFVYWKHLCHFCDGTGYNDGNNNRGCSLINHIFDKLNLD
jgi:hypothetical protein